MANPYPATQMIKGMTKYSDERRRAREMGKLASFLRWISTELERWWEAR